MTLSNMDLAVNRAVDDWNLAAQRRGLINGNVGSSDGKRPDSWCEFGFPRTLGFAELHSMWRRGGVAHGAVGKIIGKCWETPPQVFEGGEENDSTRETPFDKQFSALAKAVRLWPALREADLRRMVGRYSGLILHYADNKQFDQPVNGRANKLVKLTPAWAGALTVKSYDKDPSSPRYGLPAMWEYKEVLADGGTLRTVAIHPDRVFVLGDISADAVAFLEPAFNALISIEKVEGGSGESFIKNASRQLAVNFDKEVDLEKIAKSYGVPVTDLAQNFKDVARKLNMGVDTLFITQGATTSPLVAQVADPTPTYTVNLQTVAAALDIPTKILVGQQTGERASTEDREYFNNRCMSRRVDMDDEIRDLIAQIGAAGALNLPSEITVLWDNLNEATQAAKFDNAKKLAEINAAASNPGYEPFSNNEIRAAAGYMPATELPPLPEGDE